MKITHLAIVSTLCVAGLVAPGSALAADTNVLVVAPDGSDSAAGTLAHPLKTIQVAVDRLAKGGTVELRAGMYQQRVKLTGVQALTLRPYKNEHAIVNGAGLQPPEGDSGLIQISNSSDVTIEDLDITGYRTTKRGIVPIGVYVNGHDSSINIVGNHVHDLGNDNNTLGSFNINAHGIAVYGDDAQQSITNLAISDNTVDNLHLGASESVVVNGNVNGWTISGNNIHDNDNIGIDAIGFESTVGGKYRYTNRNRARNGVISNNVVARIRSQGNPAYWEDGGWCNCADGIYVDGGTHIQITGNRVSDSDIGIEVAAENPHGAADHVITENNHVTGSLYVGITTGGYCNGADDCGGVETGASFDNTFEYNTLRGNNRLDDGSPELLVQYHAYRDTFEHNTITATNTDHVVYGTVPDADTDGHPGTMLSDDNTFAAVGGSVTTAEFGWHGHTYTGFAAYRQATGQDAHSTFN
jgi:hypothetical protein